MRIAGFADTHLLGAGLPGASQVQWRQEDFLNAANRVVGNIASWKPDLVLFAGDAFQSRNPSQIAIYLFMKLAHKLSLVAPLVIIPGNHDLTSSGSVLKGLELLDNIYYIETPHAIEVAGAQVFGMPWITGKHLAAKMATADKDAINRDMEKLARTGIQAFLAQPFDGPRIFLGHLIMLGASFGGFAPVTLGREIFWQSSWLDGFDAALLGHIHNHQFPDPSRPWICYAGSIERLDFGERDEAKGWVSIDLSDERPEWEFHPIPVRPMVQIEMDAQGTEIAFPDIPKEAILKVILHLQAGQSAPDIRADCKYILPPIFLWEGQERRFRGPEQIAKMGVEEQLAAYWESKEIPPGRQEMLMVYAREVMGDARQGDAAL